MNTEVKVARPYGVAPPAFRLPDATTLGPVHLQVSNLMRSLEYYQRVIGLRAEEIADDTAVLTAHGDDRALVVLHSRRGVTRARRGAFGLYHFALLLPDRAALGRFAAHLAAQHIQIGMADHLVSEALYLSDPDGLGIEIYADRPRATWHYRDRELAMTTDPLDITSLIAAGRGETWDGAPANTTMGHVHCTSAIWTTQKRSTIARSGSTRPCGATRERCSCRPVAITITWAPTSGHPGPLPEPMTRGSSPGS